MLKNNKKKIEVNPFIVGGVVFGIIAVVLLIVSFMMIFRTNPYGDEIKIDNLSEYYDNLPQQQKDMIFSQLYDMVKANVDDDKKIPNSGALVREGYADYDYDNTMNVYYGNFVVDIPEIEMSFRVQFEWSPNEDNEALGGYPVVITCLEIDLQIYENSKCQETIEETVDWDNAFQLDYTFGTNTSYKVCDRIGEFLRSMIDKSFINVHIDESTLVRLKEQPDLTYAFDILVDDENIFNIVVRLDLLYGDEYIAIYISGSQKDVGFVISNNDETVAMLSDWLREFSEITDLLINVQSGDN